MSDTKTGGETVVMTLRLPKHLYARIKQQAEADVRSMNSYVTVTLDKAVPEP